jgi:hypothetical protein
MGGQHARQPGGEPGADGHGHATLARLEVEVEQGPHLGDLVGDRDHVDPRGHEATGGLEVGAGGTGQHRDVDVQRVGVATGVDAGALAQRPGHRVEPRGPFVAQYHGDGAL